MQVQDKYTQELMAIDGVVGTGLEQCGFIIKKPCIGVLLVNDSSDLKKQIPQKLEGYKVVTKVTGEIHLL